MGSWSRRMPPRGSCSWARPGDQSLVGLELASILEPVPSPSDKPQCLRGRRLDGAGIALRASVAAGERPNRMFLRLCRDHIA